MKISYSWLKEHIDFNLSPKELSNKLTLAGLEVESIEGKDASDTILEINITPNRPDCLSVIGIAREVSALTGFPVKYPDNKVVEKGNDIKKLTSVAIKDKLFCPRYSARVIQGIKVGPSPQWLIDKLNSTGIRSINNIVDITNFVLTELGHPLHAFDYDLLEENKIVVRRGLNGERFIALDNTTCDINDTMLVIADGKRPVAIAGVIGGKDTEVSQKTTAVLLESAYFEPTQVRRTSKKLGIQTESSYRFERGADPEVVLKALNRAAGLILKMAGGNAAKGIFDIYPSPLISPEITLQLNKVNKILGTNLSEQNVKKYMKKLGFSVLQKKEKGCYKIKVPSYRRDITREIDLIEEIARIHGYENIEVKKPQFKIERVNPDKFHSFVKEVKIYFKEKGFCEAINYSFISDEMQNLFENNSRGIINDDIFIQNPISNDWRVMRKSLIPGLLTSLHRNLNKGFEDIRLFEMGRQYNAVKKSKLRSSDTAVEQNKNGLAKETYFLAGIVTSKVERKMWKKGDNARDIFYIKGIIEIFLENMHLKKYNFKKSHLPAFDNLIEIHSAKNKIGIIGSLNQPVTDKLGITDKLFVFEINLDALYKLQEKSTTFQTISKYPGVLRDLAVLADRNIQSKEIEEFIRQKGTSLLKDMTLFDCYEGKSIPPEKRSLAYSLIFRNDKRTLKDEEVDTIFDNIVKGLTEKFDAHLRT